MRLVSSLQRCQTKQEPIRQLIHTCRVPSSFQRTRPPRPPPVLRSAIARGQRTAPSNSTWPTVGQGCARPPPEGSESPYLCTPRAPPVHTSVPERRASHCWALCRLPGSSASLPRSLCCCRRQWWGTCGCGDTLASAAVVYSACWRCSRAVFRI